MHSQTTGMKQSIKIVLIGYMASGKTVVAKELALRVNLPFIDLDDYIAKKEKLRIPEIFAQKGESYFRKMEYKYLIELLNQDQSVVLSVGGGTPTYEDAMDIINQKASSVYLKSGVQTLYNRLAKSEKSERPILEYIDTDLLKEYIAMHLSEREIYYTKAHFTIAVDALSISEIAEKIAKKINYSK